MKVRKTNGNYLATVKTYTDEGKVKQKALSISGKRSHGISSSGETSKIDFDKKSFNRADAGGDF